MSRYGLLGAVIVAATLTGVNTAEAQITPEAVMAEANALHEMAIDAYASGAADVAGLVEIHARAADLRLTSDPRAAECARFHGVVLHMSGDLEGAQAYLERAAELALAKDDVYGAAFSYVEAAFAAQEAGRRDDAVRLAKEARRLTSGGGLTQSQRQLFDYWLPAEVAHR